MAKDDVSSEDSSSTKEDSSDSPDDEPEVFSYPAHAKSKARVEGCHHPGREENRR
jgi:hypothetical protein